MIVGQNFLHEFNHVLPFLWVPPKTSLNNVLLTGPDLSNSLLGVLLRFRREMIAVTADIQHMFHCFIVQEDHRNDKSGPVSRTLFSDIPLNFAEEWNTPRIWSGFFG
jgi:hypothetical protein